MKLRRCGTWFVLTALTLGAYVGCGGDDSSNNTSSSTSSSSSTSGTGGAGGTGGKGGSGGMAAGGGGNGGSAGGGGSSAAVDWPTIHSPVMQDPAIEQAITDLIAKMTVEQKVGQITQPENPNITPAEVKQYHIGSVLSGGGAYPNGDRAAPASAWVTAADAYYNASTDTSGGDLGIPIIWGIDALHGHNKMMGATVFPHNIALGAANDPDLMEKIGTLTAKQVVATGLDWTFAPTVAVVRDDRWGRTYESYSEDPVIVKSLAGRVISGLQGKADGGMDFLGATHIISTAKHFLGDGGTDHGKDQGNNLSTEQQLLDIHAQGYIAAVQAGVQTIMASYNSWQGKKMHGNHYLLTDILKGKFNFDGFVIGDWNAHGQLPGCTNTHCPDAVNAGVDMIMVPSDWKEWIANTVADVKAGTIPMTRIDDAVRRILRVKMRLGLLGPHKTKNAPSTRPGAGAQAQLATAELKNTARTAVRESLVLLKNKGHVLPLHKTAKILVVGPGANDIGRQCGGWTIDWQGASNTNADFPNGTSILTGIQQAVTTGTVTYSADGSLASSNYDAAVVVIGETPYAEFKGDINGELSLEDGKRDKAADQLLLNTVRSKAPNLPIVTVLLSGRPLYVNRELNRSDAFVAAWLPGTEGGGLADVLFGDADFHGKLSFSWPAGDCQTPLNKGDGQTPLFPYGFGLNYTMNDTLQSNLPEMNWGVGCP